jgi:hypothetical protein
MMIKPFKTWNDHPRDRDAVLGLRQIDGDRLGKPDGSQPLEQPVDSRLRALKLWSRRT